MKAHLSTNKQIKKRKMLGTPKKCAKCDKQVYPIEELKCLDKVWHKICFKCTVCNSLLNMKNYKGFEKLPYCYVHYPQQKHTQVSDNPEMLRIKENTKIQSNAKYHEDFEKSKGNYTVVADDPETRRILENTKLISQVRYHEDFEKNIKKKYTPVIDSPETTRAIENQKLVSSVEYKGIRNQNSNSSLNNSNSSYSTSTLNNSSSSSSNNNNGVNNTNNNNNSNNNNNTTLIATFRSGEPKKLIDNSQRRIGSIADYDPLNQENGNGLSNGSNGNGHFNNSILNKQYNFNVKNQQQKQQHTTNGNGHSNGNGHLNGNGHSNGSNGHKINTNGNGYYHDLINDNNDNNNNNHSNGKQHIHQQPYDFINDIKTSVYKAIYDYDAREDDEISFRDGDKFINCEQIDIGWMIGVHEKTGKHGMFPSNYAEAIDLF